MDAETGGAAAPAAVETWTLRHPERGLIRVHIGPDARLRELDGGFPVAEAARATEKEAPPGDDTAGQGVAHEDSVEPDGTVERRLRDLGLDDVPRRVLVTVDATPHARLKHLRNTRVSLQPKAADNLADGAFTEPVPVLEAPMLKLDSNMTDSWMRTIVYKEDGQPGVELDPPEESRAARRYAAMAASPWKRVVYPLTAGLGKGGGALAGILLVPILLGVLRPVFDWLRSLLPDIEVGIPWPDIDLPVPDIDIPWPDWSLPEFTAPNWVILLLDYSKVWIPVLLGLALGILAVRRYRKSREIKREWRQAVEDPSRRPDADADGGAG